MPGTHTVRRRERRPFTVASATFSGVVANGAAFNPVVIFDTHEARSDDQHVHAIAGQRVAQPLGKAVDARFGAP